jgi:hypothetical protein
MEVSSTKLHVRSRFISSSIYQWGGKTSFLAMVHGVVAVDIGGSVVYGAVDRNEEMGLRFDWSIGGIGCGRGYYDGGWTDLWRKDH